MADAETRAVRRDYAFRRDCLEADIVKDGRVLTLFVCHFKSMYGGRRKTRAVRRAEAQAVRLIIERRFPDPANAEWVILGDFNDYFERDGHRLHNHGLGPLIDGGFAVDLATHAIADPMTAGPITIMATTRMARWTISSCRPHLHSAMRDHT